MIRAILLQPNEGCLTMARVLVRRGVEVHALTDRSHSYVLASRGVHGLVAHSTEWLDLLLKLGDGVVLSGSDAATQWLTNHRHLLPQSLRTFESVDRVHLDMMDKAWLYREASAIGITVPRAHHVRRLVDLPDQLDYPCIIKPSFGHIAKSLVGVGTTVVRSRDHLVDLAGLLLDRGLDCVVTELVPGPERLLEGAVLVRQPDGSYPLRYTRRKIRQWPIDTGVGSSAVSATLPDTMALSERLLDHVGYHGIAAVETKRHEHTGKLYLVEVNVRVPALFGLSEACGVDGPWRLYATLTGLPLGPQPAQVDGRRLMLPHLELRSALRHLRRRDTSLPAIMRDWLGTTNFGVLSVRDPGPALVFVGGRLRRRIIKLRRWPRRVSA